MIQENQFRMLQDEYLHRIQKTDTSNKRYLYHQINWDARPRFLNVTPVKFSASTTSVATIVLPSIKATSTFLFFKSP